MTFSVEITDVVHAQLDEIYVQVSSNFGKAIAKKSIDKIIEQIMNLSDFPRMGHNGRKAGLNIPSNYYLLFLKRNTLVYQIIDDEKIILIEEIYDAHQEIATAIQNKIGIQRIQQKPEL